MDDFVGMHKVPRENVIIAPGNHDISRVLCRQARERSALEGGTFSAPYLDKFNYYHDEIRRFYELQKIDEALFSIRKHNELGVMTIALNSCFAESELDADHYGDLGPIQLHSALSRAKEVDPNHDLVRIVVLHHGLEPNTRSPQDSLREPERVVQTCQDHACRLLLHGHTHVPRAYIKGLPHKPLIYVLSSGSTGLEHHSLPDLPNHYSLIKLQVSGLTRIHRQFSTRLIDEKTGYGRWSTDATEFEAGIEEIKFDQPLDYFNLSVYRAGDRKDIRNIVRHCRWETRNEIGRVANRKYIKDLYIDREIESSLQDLFVADEHLATKLSELKDATYKIVSAAKKEESAIRDRLKKIDAEIQKHAKGTITSSIPSEAAERKRRQHERLSKVRGKIDLALLIDNKLNEILVQDKPCSGKHRPALKDMLSTYERLRSQVEDTEHAIVDNAMQILRPASRSITVVVDRAGGGKTNLLCHLADLNSLNEPTIFIGGRLPILSDDSLIDAIAEKMGCTTSEGSLEYIRNIDVVLEETACHATIFIDGINENRDITGLSRAINKFSSAMELSRFRLVLTCRDIYWGFFEDQGSVSGVGPSQLIEIASI